MRSLRGLCRKDVGPNRQYFLVNWWAVTFPGLMVYLTVLSLSLVGDSGSGKSVTALAIMRLVELRTRAKLTGGEVLFRHNGGEFVDLLALSERQLRRVRGNDISMVFQEPLTSLNPVYTTGDQVIKTIRLHQRLGARAASEGALEVLERVRIPRPERVMADYPHQLSGSMRQRVMIAMALSCDRNVLIADEPTTALDVTI